MDINKIILQMETRLDEKKALLDRIMIVTKNQVDTIKNKEFDHLVRTTEQKDLLIRKIDDCDIKFLELVELIKEVLHIESLENIEIAKYPEFGEVKKKVAGIIELITEIKSIDDKNIENARSLKLETDKKVGEIRTSKKVKSAYDVHKENKKAVFFDKKT